MELDSWEDVAWDFQLVFFYLFIVSLVLLGCYPEGLGCFFIPALKVVIFHLFVFRFFFDFREMAFLTKK